MEVPPDPIASSVYGLGKLILEGAGRFIERVRNRELSGSDDPEVIELVKAERKVPEFQLIKRYIPDRDLRVQAQLGLALRRMQGKAGQRDELENLRAHLQRVYGLPGLHVAELSEVGILTAYLELLIREEGTDTDISERLTAFLRGVDTYVLFVVAKTPVDRTLEKVRMRLASTGPGTVAIFAKGEACDRLHQIVKLIRRDPEDYIVRGVVSGDQEIVFVSAFNTWMDLSEEEPPKRLARAARAPEHRRMRRGNRPAGTKSQH